MTVGGLIRRVASRLPGDTPALDAQVLLAHILKRDRTWLAAHPEAGLTAPELDSVEEAVARLERGAPLPYVIGHWEFYGRDYEVTPDVLIPRPETETLVETAVSWLQKSAARRTVADVGTGSGVIGISIAAALPDAYVLATDTSLPALRVAHRNAGFHGVRGSMDFVQCDLLPPHHSGIPGDLHFDLICANLPYIPSDTLRGLPIYGREPMLALNGGRDGLTLIGRLLHQAVDWLAPNGLILVEIETSQGIKAVSLAYDMFAEAEIHLHRDLHGHDRLLEIAL